MSNRMTIIPSKGERPPRKARETRRRGVVKSQSM
jgi:hypothetical protein